MSVDIDRTKAVYDNCSKQIAVYEGQIEKLEEQIESSKDIDLESEKRKAAELNEEKKNLTHASDEVKRRIEFNKSAVENIGKKVSELNIIETRCRWLKSLHDTVNGKIKGQEKIMLEAYIQMTYFDRILARANTRLMIMTDGQYDFIRRKESGTQGQVGLELDVIDHYNGTERSVNSLSGGEKFKASLSLALGLSDEIQATTGGISVDTMFIDEGFGSLDDESRAQAMKALAKLSNEGNRLIGIISHVGELKDKIDKQIIVTKDGVNGSDVRVIA